jgi:hypothetical protein
MGWVAGACWGRPPENGGGGVPSSWAPFEHPKIAMVAVLVISLLRAIVHSPSVKERG